MASLFSALNLIPRFPAYTGPFQVGSIEYEVPISALRASEKSPKDGISTVQFRVFYPCEKASSKTRPVRWIPEPQRGYLDGYARFTGAGKTFSSILASMPSILNCISIPVQRDAILHKPDSKTEKWPVMIFSHGLGGTRHMYSYLIGSLASHGIICIAPEHRDGSCPVSFINTSLDSGEDAKESLRNVEYLRISHKPSTEVEEARNDQLRLRLWELSQIHEALHKLDAGKLDQYAQGSSMDKAASMPPSMFQNSLEIHKPGSIIWGGHSFGSATTVQFLKSVYYSSSKDESFPNSSLVTLSKDSSLKTQITPQTPAILLDLWCFPIEAASTRSLFEKPLPTYASSGPQGRNLLCVCSEAFFKWKGNFTMASRIISPHPADEKPKSTPAGPRFFYPATSAHLSQSDFGMLFPWVTKRAFKAEEPERTMRLNIRAILQVLRDSGIHVAPTSREDMEMTSSPETSPAATMDGDPDILATDGRIRAWIPLSLGNEVDSAALSQTTDLQEKAEPFDAIVEGEVIQRRASDIEA